jgi:DNA-binding NarL/FixJ family response regulator
MQNGIDIATSRDAIIKASDEVVNLYKSGLSTYAISRETKMCFETVQKIIKKNFPEVLTQMEMTKKSTAQVISLREEGLSTLLIARTVKISEPSVRKILKENGIPTSRTRVPS